MRHKLTMTCLSLSQKICLIVQYLAAIFLSELVKLYLYNISCTAKLLDFYEQVLTPVYSTSYQGGTEQILLKILGR